MSVAGVFLQLWPIKWVGLGLLIFAVVVISIMCITHNAYAQRMGSIGIFVLCCGVIALTFVYNAELRKGAEEVGTKFSETYNLDIETQDAIELLRRGVVDQPEYVILSDLTGQKIVLMYTLSEGYALRLLRQDGTEYPYMK